jgi:hypothetical protein
VHALLTKFADDPTPVAFKPRAAALKNNCLDQVPIHFPTVFQCEKLGGAARIFFAPVHVDGLLSVRVADRMLERQLFRDQLRSPGVRFGAIVPMKKFCGAIAQQRVNGFPRAVGEVEQGIVLADAHDAYALAPNRLPETPSLDRLRKGGIRPELRCGLLRYCS